jgi:hypothetical protein
MSLLNREAIERLAVAPEGLKVSLFLPSHRTSPEREQDAIRFKNLLRDAEAALVAAGMRTSDPQGLLSGGYRLLDDHDFWMHQADGLAVFAQEGWLATHRLPYRVEDLSVVGERFHLKPLLPLLSEDGRFHVLALSQNSVRLVEASRDAAREVDLHDIPASLRDAVGYDWQQRSLQFHTGTGASTRGLGGAMFHGQGRPGDSKEAEITTFLRLVDSGVAKLLGTRRMPLVLAAVDFLIPMYRGVSAHPDILDAAVVGNPDELTIEELHREAWALVKPRVRARRLELSNSFVASAGTAMTSDDVGEVVPAAFDGRLDTLFVALGERRWGTFDARMRRLEQHDTHEPGDYDLLDLAAVQGLIRDATVYAVAPDEVPGGGVVAAIFRY